MLEPHSAPRQPAWLASLPVRILVVDDDPDMRRLIAVPLRRDGYLVTEFNDGNEFVEFVEGDVSLAPDAVILDLMMPGIDGYETFTRLRASKRPVPIILITSLGEEGIDNESLQGATAVLHKPFEPERLRYLIQSVVNSRGDGPSSTAAHRVLVADDDGDMRHLVSHALSKDGCEVIEVADGAELIEYMGACLLVKSHVSRPEVIISDMRMPGFNGLQILAWLRNEKWKIPVILITALDDPKTYQDAARLGVAAFLQKPFDLDHLRRTVRELVR